MPKKPVKTFSITIEEVRKWRKKAFNEVMAMTTAQRAAEERRFAKEFGLKIYKPPTTKPRKKAG